MDIETPCKKDCLYNPKIGYCESCGRTLDDLSKWISLTKEERRDRINLARKRINKNK